MGALEEHGSARLAVGDGVETIQQQKITEMKELRRGGFKIHMLDIEQSVGAALMKEGPPAGVCDRHHVGVARRGLRGCLQLGWIDPASSAIRKDGASIFVIANQTCAGEREERA